MVDFEEVFAEDEEPDGREEHKEILLRSVNQLWNSEDGTGLTDA